MSVLKIGRLALLVIALYSFGSSASAQRRVFTNEDITTAPTPAADTPAAAAPASPSPASSTPVAEPAAASSETTFNDSPNVAQPTPEQEANYLKSILQGVEQAANWLNDKAIAGQGTVDAPTIEKWQSLRGALSEVAVELRSYLEQPPSPTPVPAAPAAVEAPAAEPAP